MDNVKWSSTDGSYAVFIRREAWERVMAESKKEVARETGGILIGLYTDAHTAIVHQATAAPRDSTSGFAWFHRGVSGLRALLLRLWEQKERLYYLGEWHYHPSVWLTPSISDIEQMREISLSANYSCPEPIMLLVGEGIACRVFVFPKGVLTELYSVVQ